MGLYIEDPKIALFLRLVVILMTMLGEANQKTLFETAMNPYQCSMILMTMLGEANQKTLFETAMNPYQCSMIGQER